MFPKLLRSPRPTPGPGNKLCAGWTEGRKFLFEHIRSLISRQLKAMKTKYDVINSI